ncbi:hypothetical protein [Enterobacter kobei]|uniref:hypothetical protein n=1 Tax=Enterobacter kobei TaxID=208224 RepID=UPI0015622CC3|nr:hypothetical protein [Enterobacter kobei]
MFAGKKSAQIREILISESAWEEMTCLFAPSLTHLDALSDQLRRRSNLLQVISAQEILSGEIKVEGEIRTLAQLFALEHHKNKEEEN